MAATRPRRSGELAARRSAEAVSAVIANAQAEARMLRTSAPSTLPLRNPDEGL
ncbi:hypothetical protein [Nonomuraea insulae]|uniref:Uncharacterized protein n=1 Tax=Nonomuraea insulae TaxID=1616787 RepID=A0ABW1CRQ0_9ACTN